MSESLKAAVAAGTLGDILAGIAEDAARVILPYWRAGAEVMTKADASLVTLADQQAEALILARLRALWPGVQIVAEEEAAANGTPDAAEALFWLIDPLDGTKGFVAGGEAFTVNIALIAGDGPVAGVVSAPAAGITWASGVRDGSPVALRRAFGGDWSVVAVRPWPDRPEALLSHSVSAGEADRLMAAHGCATWRGVDSSLKFCLIAEGGADVYPRTGPTSEWDTAAGQAVLEAAGGQMLAPDGTRFRYGKPGFRNGGFTAWGGRP